MAKYLEFKDAPTVDPMIWDHTKQFTDGQGGGFLNAADLTAGINLKKGALINMNLSTKEVNVVKNALVLAEGTTSAIRVAKTHLFKVGDFVFVSGASVKISSIDTTNSSYDVINVASACAGATEGTYLEQASEAAASPSVLYNANALLGEKIIDVQGNEPAVCVMWVMELIQKSKLPYAASPARLADLTSFKFN